MGIALKEKPEREKQKSARSSKVPAALLQLPRGRQSQIFCASAEGHAFWIYKNGHSFLEVWPYVDSVEWGLREIYGLIFIILGLKVSPLPGALGKGSQRKKRRARKAFSLISSLLQLASSLLWEAS